MRVDSDSSFAGGLEAELELVSWQTSDIEETLPDKIKTEHESA